MEIIGMDIRQIKDIPKMNFILEKGRLGVKYMKGL